MKKSRATLFLELALAELRRHPDPIGAAKELYARECDAPLSIERNARIKAAMQILRAPKPVRFNERALGNE